MIEIKKPLAILFDWDGTLADTWEIITEASDSTFKTFGKIEVLDNIKQTVHRHKSMRDIFPIIFGEQWQEAAEFYKASYHKLRHDKLKLMPFAKQVLDFLKNNTSIYMAIISNKQGIFLREELDILGVTGYFSKIVGSGDTIYDKPSPEPAFLALEASGVFPDDQVWILGDSILDMECAFNAGVRGLLFGTVDQHEMQDCKAPYVRIKDFRQFLETLQRFY